MEVRGTALRSSLVACEQVFGRGSAARVLAALSDEDRAVCGGTILGASWYPVRHQAALQEAIRVELGKGSLEANRRVGRQAALDDFRGVYRVFLPMLTWDLLWSSLGRAWLRYNSQGEVLFEQRPPNSALCMVRGVLGYTEPMWHAVSGRLAGIIELAGGREARTRVAHYSASSVQVLLTWSR